MNPANQASSEIVYEDPFLILTPTYLTLRAFKPWTRRDLQLPLKTITKIKEVRLAIYNGLTWHEKAWLDFRWPHDWRVKDRKEGFLIHSDYFPIPIGTTGHEPQVIGMHFRKLMPNAF